MKVTVKQTGPLFDGSASKEVKQAADEMELEIGKQTVNAIQTELGRVLKHPTGYYKSHVQTDRAQNDLAVTDGGVVYGPWLEGVSSRNRSSRFKGYATFRRITQRMQGKVVEIGNKVMSKHIGRMQ